MSDLRTLLPPNASAADRAVEQATARPDRLPMPVSSLWSPQTCPPDALPALAWALSVDEWDASWPDDTKRAVISASVMVHRRKGTVGAVLDALTAAGYPDARLVEGLSAHRFDGTQMHNGGITYGNSDHWAKYTIYMTRPITRDQAGALISILATVAPARCHLGGVNFIEAANSHNGAARYDGTYTYGVVT